MNTIINKSLKATAALVFIFLMNSSFILDSPIKKEAIIKIYTDPTTKGTLLVSLLHEKNQDLQFYIFDLEGKMIDNFLLKTKTINKIGQLRKGIYMYDVFKNDESIERGSVELK